MLQRGTGGVRGVDSPGAPQEKTATRTDSGTHSGVPGGRTDQRAGRGTHRRADSSARNSAVVGRARRRFITDPLRGVLPAASVLLLKLRKTLSLLRENENARAGRRRNRAASEGQNSGKRDGHRETSHANSPPVCPESIGFVRRDAATRKRRDVRGAGCPG